MVRIIGIIGSLRKSSYSVALLRTATKYSIHDDTRNRPIKAIPIYDGGMEASHIPTPVAKFNRTYFLGCLCGSEPMNAKPAAQAALLGPNRREADPDRLLRGFGQGSMQLAAECIHEDRSRELEVRQQMDVQVM